MPRCSHCREIVSEEQFDKVLGICRTCDKDPEVHEHRAIQNNKGNRDNTIRDMTPDEKKRFDELHEELYS